MATVSIGAVPTGETLNIGSGKTIVGEGKITLAIGTITTSQPAIDGTQTWNAVGVTFAADKINVTNTASASGSTLIDRQIGGTSMFKVDKDGTLTLNSGSATESLTITTASGSSEAKISAARKLYLKATGGYNAILETSGAFQLYSGSASAFMYPDANYILALRSGTNAQTFRSYYTYTDSSNYQRLGLNTAAASVEFAAESAGTGAANIDVKLTPKGTGVVQFGTHTATSDTAVSGYITVKDSGGTTRKLAVIT